MCRVSQTINKQAECVRDYKRYLSSDPTPGDYSEIQAELADYVEQRKQEMRNPPGAAAPSATYTANGTRQQSQPQPGYGAHTGKAYYPQPGASSSGAGGGSGRPGSGGAGLGAGKGPHPYASHWNDDREDFYSKFEKFKVQYDVLFCFFLLVVCPYA